MRDLKLIVVMWFIPSFVWAASPQATPRIYPLLGEKKGQVVMITARVESIGREFATFEDYDDVTPKFFHENQSVWVRCDNDAPNINKIESISEQTQGSMSLKTVVLRDALSCNGAALLSNHPLQEQRWKSRKPDPSDYWLSKNNSILEKHQKLSLY